MFIYLLIAFELGILYTVFWYIYVQEPKSINLSGFSWGNYDLDAPDLIPVVAENPQQSPWMVPGQYIQHPENIPVLKQVAKQNSAWKVRSTNIRGRHRHQSQLARVAANKTSWLQQLWQWLGKTVATDHR